MRNSYCVGVDVGGTRLRLIAQGTLDGRRTIPVEIPVPRSMSDMVSQIEVVARAAVGDAPIESLAIGLPGQVLDDRCIWVPNLRFLDGQPLARAVASRVGAPCHLINDAQATLVAESGEGAAQGVTDVVLLAVGTGIGGAYQAGGRIVRGANGCAGAFGWLPFPGSVRDADHGPWEQAGSGLRLEELAREWGGTPSLIWAARHGDQRARRALDDFAAVLGQGAAALASVLDPDLIVFAGGLVTSFDLLKEAVAEALAQHGSPAGGTVHVVPAALGSTAGVIGALRWARGAAGEFAAGTAGQEVQPR
jgi:predicted NBD/HSP70 family sugar kinase